MFNSILSGCFHLFNCANKIEQLHYAVTSLYYLVKFDQEVLFNSKVCDLHARFLYIPDGYVRPFNTPHQFSDMFNLLYLDGEMLMDFMNIHSDMEYQRRIHVHMMDRMNEDLYKLEPPEFTRAEEFYLELERFLKDNVSILVY